MPRRSISVHVLTAGQECARARRLDLKSVLIVLDLRILGGMTSSTKARGRYLYRSNWILSAVSANRNRHLGVNGGVPGMASSAGMAEL